MGRGRKQLYAIELSEEQRGELKAMLGKGVLRARVMTRARILLLSDQGQTNRMIAAALQIAMGTVLNVQRRFMEHDLDNALHDRPRPGAQPLLGPKQIATLIAETCSDAPDGHAKWTMQLLADRIVTLGVVERISDETVRRTLKKMPSNLGKSKAGVSPK